LGIHDVYFKENTNLYEWYPNNDNPYFEHLNYGTNLETTGNGFNFKIGAIFKPIESLRLGIAIHTPTFYKLSDNYYNTIESHNADDNGIMGNHSAQPDQNTVYDYRIDTPLKTIFSGAYVIGKTAIISIDYEIVDFSSIKFISVYDGDNFTNENRDIKNAYRSVGNLHLGGEFRVNRNFSLRAGYENYPSVYKSNYMDLINPNSKASFSTVSGGFGYKQGNFFFDAAVKHTVNDEYSKLYPDATDMAKYASNQNNVIMTFGYKF
jgi:long-subunit fatty acid transport protein